MASIVQEVTEVPPQLQHRNPSRPAEELPGKITAQSLKDCTELYMGHKAIDIVWGFDRFVNLEVLWLNHNQLSNIDGLDLCSRMKELYVHHNKLETLEGSILSFKFLSTLVVSHNRLAGLDNVLDCLKKLPFLKHLELHDNPCAQELGYRSRILAAMPHLEILDRHVVSAEELDAAKASQTKLRGRRGDAAKSQRPAVAGLSARSVAISPMRSSKASQLLSSSQRAHGHRGASAGGGGGAGGTAPQAATKVTQLLDREARKVRRQQRLAEIRAAQDLFQAGTAATRNLQSLGGAVPPSALTTTVLDGEVGVTAAGVAASMHARGVQPHETSAMAKAGWGVVTATNQGALTASLRDLQTQANPLRGAGGGEMEFKAASTAAAVRFYRPGAAGGGRTWQAPSTGAGRTHVPGLATGEGRPPSEGTYVMNATGLPAVGLGPWEVYHVRRMFEDADSNGDGVLSPAELGGILARAEDYGVALDGTTAASAVQDIVQRMMASADEDGDGRLDWREFLDSIASGGGGVRFRCLSAPEARSKSEALFARAGRLQKRILRSAPGDSRVVPWQSQALSLGERGGRLAELAARLEGKYDPPEAPPTSPPKRNDHYQTSALVPVRQAAKTRQRGMRHYQVPAPGQESDSDSDEGLPGALKHDSEYAQYRARRKNRKAHTVMTKTTFL